jgi:hypothetical protein
MCPPYQGREGFCGDVFGKDGERLIDEDEVREMGGVGGKQRYEYPISGVDFKPMSLTLRSGDAMNIRISDAKTWDETHSNRDKLGRS